MGIDIYIYVERYMEGRWWFAGEMEPHDYSGSWRGFAQARLNAIEYGEPEVVPFQPRPLCEGRRWFAYALYRHDTDTSPLFEQRGAPEDLSAELASLLDLWRLPREDMTWMTLEEVLAQQVQIEQTWDLYPLWDVWETLLALDDHAAHRLVVVCSA